MGANYDAGFLGLSLKPNDTVMGSVHAIFTDGSRIFLIYVEGGVYALKGGKPECVISERLYDESRVSFDGENIYYINKKMELKSYGTATGKTERIAGGFPKRYITTDHVCFIQMPMEFSLTIRTIKQAYSYRRSRHGRFPRTGRISSIQTAALFIFSGGTSPFANRKGTVSPSCPE